MNGIWTAFAIMICFVMAILGWEVFNNPASLILLALGVVFLLKHPKAKKKGNQKNKKDIFKMLGLLLMVLGLGQNISFWFLLLIVLFFGVLIFGSNASWTQGKRSLNSFMPWNKKAYVAPEAAKHTAESLQRRSHRWFGDTTIGESIYTWDDINLSILAGDTIVDLGNTLLPANRENVILLRKGFGRTRILVPVGTKVVINHSALLGKLKLDDQVYQLQNETMHLTLNNQEDARELRIITNVLVGDLEVVYV